MQHERLRGYAGLRGRGIILTILLAGCSLAGAALFVSCGGGGGTAVSVIVRPAQITLAPSAACTFTAEVSGTTNTAVTWGVTEAGGGSITAAGAYTAPVTEGTYHVVAASVAAPATSGSAQVTVQTGVLHGLTKLFFLHHSVGDGLVVQGDMRGEVAVYNAAAGTHFEFWDHGYNADGLRNAAGESTGTNYNIPDDNTDPEGLYWLWTSAEARYVTCRNLILDNHQVIAFKSCFPNSAIADAAMLQQYKTWYLAMRDFFDTRPDRLFVVMSTPPLHRLATNPTEAANARAFADWLSSATYLNGHPNVRCFNLFDYLAKANDGSPTANMLRYEYEGSHSDSDSHPNNLADQTVGPIFADFLCSAAAGY